MSSPDELTATGIPALDMHQRPRHNARWQLHTSDTLKCKLQSDMHPTFLRKQHCLTGADRTTSHERSLQPGSDGRPQTSIGSIPPGLKFAFMYAFIAVAKPMAALVSTIRAVDTTDALSSSGVRVLSA